MPGITAWAFLVVSSDRQAETLDDQRDWSNQAAALNGWEITRTFSGVSSGATGSRKLLKQLLSELEAVPKAQRPKRVLMTRLDRTGRGLGMEPMAAFAQIYHLGVTIFTREDGEMTISRASDTLKPLLRILVGAMENETRSDKWKAVHARRRAAGLHVGSIPYGCVLIEGKAVPYEPEARIVREIFRLAAQGWGYTRLARWARENAPPKKMHNGTDRKLSWAPSSIKSTLESKTVRGLIVSEDEWQAAFTQRGVDFKARSPKRWPWPLTGAVRCLCGKMLSGHCAGSDPWRTRYYICRHHSLDKNQTAHPAHRADDLEAAFVDLLHRLDAQPDFLITPEPDGNHKAREQEAKARAVAANQRRSKAWALAEGGALTGAQLRERLDEIEADRAQAESDLAAASREGQQASSNWAAVTSVRGVLRLLAEAWPTADVQDQQEAARAVAACVGGLWVAPEHKAVLMAGNAPGAMVRKADVSRILALGAGTVTPWG